MDNQVRSTSTQAIMAFANMCTHIMVLNETENPVKTAETELWHVNNEKLAKMMISKTES